MRNFVKEANIFINFREIVAYFFHEIPHHFRCLSKNSFLRNFNDIYYEEKTHRDAKYEKKIREISNFFIKVFVRWKP